MENHTVRTITHSISSNCMYAFLLGLGKESSFLYCNEVLLWLGIRLLEHW